MTSLNKQQRRIRGERAQLGAPTEIAKELRADEHGRLFFRIPKPGRSIQREAGYVRKDGYRAVKSNGQTYLAHRLVWCLFFGRWPTEQLDHCNGNKLDNRVENLREVTPKQNRLNVKNTRNDSGIVGVTWAKKEQNWRATIFDQGKCVNLGHFATLKEAIQCRKAAEVRLGYLQE